MQIAKQKQLPEGCYLPTTMTFKIIHLLLMEMTAQDQSKRKSKNGRKP